jgi:hypothetical protein
MRACLAALSAPAFALALQGCTLFDTALAELDSPAAVIESLPFYNCPASCNQMATVIAQAGWNPETSDVGGMDPAAVCGHEAITSAFTCGGCERAIADTYRIHLTTVACDCPHTSFAADDPDNLRVRYVDAQCEEIDEPFSPSACVGFRGNRHRSPGSCTQPSPLGGVAAGVAPPSPPGTGDAVGPASP